MSFHFKKSEKTTFKLALHSVVSGHLVSFRKMVILAFSFHFFY